MYFKSNPVVLFDADSTLFDWDHGFNVQAAAVNPAHRYVPREQRTKYGWMLGEGHDPAVNHAAFHAPGFYRNLTPYEGAVEALRAMRKIGIDTWIATTPYPTHETCASEKLACFEEHLGHEMVLKTILTHDKTGVMGDLLIDDKPEIFGRFSPRWQRIFYDQPYNAGLPGPRITHWDLWEDTVIPALVRLGH